MLQEKTWLSLVIVVICSRFIWRLFFHPLSRFPGPKLAAISNLPYVKWSLNGELHTKIQKLHDRYGDVIRIRPNALTYRSAEAWADIYSHRKAGKPSFDKDPQFYIASSSGGKPNLINSNNEDHSRQKRLLTHAFSERSLREQEELILGYIDLFIGQLDKYATRSSNVQHNVLDLVRWLNFLTFDIIGDLAFGEPFGCLKDSEYHPWVSTMFQSIKTGAFLRALSIYPILAFLIRKAMPKRLIQKRIQHYQLSKERVNRRLEMNTSRPDFISYILRYNDERTMDTSEIQTNAALIIQAGSETTATALAACNFYLQKNRDCYSKLTEEIRTYFTSEDEMTFLSVAKLPFLNAVIEEGLRMYPPSPAIGPRVVPKGGAPVCGEVLPEDTSVSVAHYSAFRGASNFEEPNSFLPQRWLKQDGKGRFQNDKREALQPFSMGPRACIGRNLAYAEMRLILCKLFWNFDIDLDSRANDWDKAKSYIVWENRPLWVHLQRARHLSEN
ncbi:hypothetical protein N7509_000267 [Penicillium cosmopolitanum]|uniref:Cytochrome P450 monooxygenase n=1 Tax=Penicillium cosmopolitanum TaxID=1131564 RepID=A0A9W9WA31_9EURO|nr:uncharacterized protein N7509_000267 [Penicillium cosmopolitanum]KAJ5413640.1 hypothetical protein N7509_000267 [Penicillium cosmopolitanum]